MTLREKQSLFARLIARLLLRAYHTGFEVTLGEAWRPKVTADAYAAKGIGIKSSLHRSRLALDINLFKNGKYLTSTESYKNLGIWWEKQDELCRWGGRFKRRDGNHFSITHGGRA
jgi:hypothetical protein